jgi:hypothetical protein
VRVMERCHGKLELVRDPYEIGDVWLRMSGHGNKCARERTGLFVAVYLSCDILLVLRLNSSVTARTLRDKVSNVFERYGENITLTCPLKIATSGSH